MSKLDAFNALKEQNAIETLLSCCASRAWAEAMTNRRPFATPGEVYQAADEVWWQLPRMEWLVAFAAHPRIGERSGDALAEREQAGVWGSDPPTLDRLKELNERYEQRFGHVFLICATGRSAAELLSSLEQRLNNDPETELRIAAGEQARITRLRLQRIIEDT